MKSFHNQNARDTKLSMTFCIYLLLKRFFFSLDFPINFGDPFFVVF